MALTEVEELELLELERERSLMGAQPQQEYVSSPGIEPEPIEQPLEELTSKLEQMPTPAEPEPEKPFIEKVFPTASQDKPESMLDYDKQFMKGVGDLLGLSTRVPAEVTGQDWGDPDAYALKPGVEGIKKDLQEKAVEFEQMLKERESEGGDPPHKAELEALRVMKEGDVGAIELIGRTFSDLAIVLGVAKGGVKQAAKGMKWLAEKPRKAVGTLLTKTTGVPEETLEAYGYAKKTRKQMKELFGKEGEVAEDLVQSIYKRKLPEEDQVAKILDDVGGFDLDQIIKELESSRDAMDSKHLHKTSINKINDLIKDYKNIKKTKGSRSTGYIDGEQLRKVRQELDQATGDIFSGNEGLSMAEKAFKDTRHKMKQMLIDTAPQEYKTIMEKYANKLNKISRVKKVVGKNAEAAELKAQGFLKNVGNNDAKAKRLKEFDKEFGTNYWEQSEAMRRGKGLSSKGTKELSPQVLSKTNRESVLATVIATAAGGSPKIAPHVLRTLDVIEWANNTGMKLPKAIVKHLPTAVKENSELLAIGKAITNELSHLSEEDTKRLEEIKGEYNKSLGKNKRKKLQREMIKIISPEEQI